ncbi:ATP synthase F1 subcomplex delta subunit [Humidesulfovibrio mexicanus]|uniref:ATP synthase subunit delta n=1 Tax=Humidesulfovibrio mexicanus TaxID=147047 RepID=A0A239CKU8_9BACT|nr:ATP synthase F1 subunit delta [Humidesulfovibrio mexicanus]SNS19973.1 ATP synthase F1 subcomplex delta subunit [Humidesulfovibrio mexicanus]
MSGNIVARRYAKALFAVGMKQGDAELEAYGKQLAGLAGALAESPEALRFFKNPVFSVEEKKAVLKQITDALGLTQTMVNFASLLADKNRLVSLPEIAEDFGAMLDEKNGIVSGKLVTAVALSDTRKVELKERLEKQTGKKLVLGFDTNAEILGGVVLQIGDSVLDASLRAQLNILKETIKRGE